MSGPDGDGDGDGDGGAPVVGVFRLQLFKPSETFITAQAGALARYRTLYIGRRLCGSPPAGAAVVAPRTLAGRLRVLLLNEPSPWVEALDGRRVDVLHAHFGVDALYARLLARRLGTPLVVTLHGFDVSRRRASLVLSGRPALLRAAAAWERLGQGADLVLAVSHAVAQAARRRGVAAVRVQPVGVDLSRLRPGGQGEPGLVVQVARLVEKKGVAVLLDAFAALVREVPHARLVVIGEGPLRRRLERQVQRLGLGERVRLLGARPHAQALDWLARAHVVAVPSCVARNGDAEGLPTVLLEAAALGRTIVASDAGGVAEALRDGESALLTAPGDAGALCAALRRLLSEPGLAVRLGAGARAAVEAGYDLHARTAELEAAYDALTLRWSPPSRVAA